MDSTFENNMQRLYNHMDSCRELHVGFTKEAIHIANYIIDRMRASNPYFKDAFRGLCLNGNHLESLKADLPDEFAMHVKLHLPFRIIPKPDPNRSGFVFLISRQHNCLSDSGYLSRDKLQKWLRAVLDGVIGNGVIHNNFRISYPASGRGYGATHRIIAFPTNQVSNFQCPRPIVLVFVPVLEFGAEDWVLSEEFQVEKKPWFAIPQGTKPIANRYFYTFMVAAPHWERKLKTELAPLKQALKLIKTLRDAHGLRYVTGYMLKNIFLLEIGKQDPEYWRKSLADLVLIMLKHVVKYMNQGFMHDMEMNHYNCVAKYNQKWKKLHGQILSLKLHGQVSYLDIARLFGLF